MDSRDDGLAAEDPSLHDRGNDGTNDKDHQPEDTPQGNVDEPEVALDSIISKQLENNELTGAQPRTLQENGSEYVDKEGEGVKEVVRTAEDEHTPTTKAIQQNEPLDKKYSLPKAKKTNDSEFDEVVTPLTSTEIRGVHTDEEIKGSDHESLASDSGEDKDTDTAGSSSTLAATLDSMHEHHREELLEEHRALLERRHKAGHLNMQLQTTLSEHFRRRRVEGGDSAHSNIDSMTSSIIDTGIDYTSRYAKHMETLAQVRNQFMEQKERLEKEINSLKSLSSYKTNKAANKQAELVEFLLDQGRRAISSRTGRPLPIEHYKNLIEMWQRKTANVAAERLENLKLQRQVEKINAAFKAYDLSESLHLIDFEQMKIENQTYNEKIEERNEETGKLSRKIMNTVQMIAHAREKLQFCQAENSQLKDQLNLWTEKSSNGRDVLSKLKQSRDALKANYAVLMRACGLLGRPEMLRGYEQSVNDVEMKKHEILNMKQLAQKLQVKAKVYEDRISHERQRLEGTHSSDVRAKTSK